MLALGGSAAWFLGGQRKLAEPSFLKSRRHAASDSPLELNPELPDAEAKTSADAIPGDQFNVSIELLRSHIEQNPAESPVPWLLLLDLLHRAGNEQEYKDTRQRCKQHFNVDMPAYKKIKGVSKKLGIESYPHIMSKLIRLWPSDEASTYLNALLHDSRDGSRVGFDLATYHDIALLRSILESVSIPQKVQNPFDS